MASIYSGYKTPQEFEESIKGLPSEAQAAYRTGFTSSSVGEGSLFQDLLNRTMDPEYLRAQLKAKSEFDKEQMRAAAPYHYLSQLPGQIAQGFGNAAAMNVLGARSAVDAMNQTLQAYPRTAFTSAPFQAQKYFS